MTFKRAVQSLSPHVHHPSLPSTSSAIPRSFYANAVVEKYASRDTKRVTLRQLTTFGRHLTLDKLLRSANYLREELPVRLAHRIIDIQHLPFIVGTNPHIQLIYSLYWQAFEVFRAFPEIKTLQENRAFCSLIEQQLQAHLVIIPQLAMGVAETSSTEHMSLEAADRFLNEMLRSRIGRRVLAEQHIALSDTFEQALASNPDAGILNNPITPIEDSQDGWIGVVNTRCKASEVVQHVSHLAQSWFRNTYGASVDPPKIRMDGHTHAMFTYIPDHIEYILFELFKNSMRYTLDAHGPAILADKSPSESISANACSESSVGSNKVTGEPLLGLTWNEPGILPGYSSRSPLRENIHTAQTVPIKGSNVENCPFHTLEPIDASQISRKISHPVPATPLSSATTEYSTNIAPESLKLPPILVTVGASESDITFRVSDQGGGFSHSQMQHLWSYTHASRHAFLENLKNASEKSESGSSTADSASNSLQRNTRNEENSAGENAAVRRPYDYELHLGLGLPMSRVYANYWGGSIGVHSMHGYGTDAYVKISLGNQLENLTWRGEAEGFV